MNYFDLKYRLKEYHRLEKTICTTKKSCKVNGFRKNKSLGSGAGGAVFMYISNDNKEKIAVKEIKITNREHENFMNTSNLYNIPSKYYRSIGMIPGINIWREITLLLLFNQLIEQNVCQTLPLTYCMLLCDNTESKHKVSSSIKNTSVQQYIRNMNQSDKSVIILQELYDGTFNDWMFEEHNTLEWLSMYFQMWYTLYILRLNQVVHLDPHENNFLLKKIKTGGYWKYNVGSKTYYVPNYGYILILNDYGLAISTKFDLDKNEKQHYTHMFNTCADMKKNLLTTTNPRIKSGILKRKKDNVFLAQVENKLPELYKQFSHIRNPSKCSKILRKEVSFNVDDNLFNSITNKQYPLQPNELSEKLHQYVMIAKNDENLTQNRSNISPEQMIEIFMTPFLEIQTNIIGSF